MVKPDRPTPYVGISGVGLPAEQLFIRQCFDQIGLRKTGRLVLLGLKGCSNQYDDRPNRRGNVWYPIGEKIASVIIPQSHELPVLQTYFGENRYDINHVSRATDLMIERTGQWLGGIQYDMFPWHEKSHTEYMSRLKLAHPALKLIVQCPKPMMDDLGAKTIAQRLSERSDFIDYALFDASHGEGKELSPKQLRPFVEAAYAHDGLSTMNFGVAGGLHGGNIDKLAELIDDYPDLSFDSESQLHFPDAKFGGKLRLEIVRGYMKAAAKLLLTDQVPDHR